MNILPILICFCFNVNHVTYDHQIPGSIMIEYTGIKKILRNETEDFLVDEWCERLETDYFFDIISLDQYKSGREHIVNFISDHRTEGVWWERNWWHSRPPDKGGAPHPRYFIVGRTGDFIDIGIARLNQDFKFKFKEYKADLTNRWKFKFKPRVTFSTKDIVSSATCVFSFTYYFKKIRRFRFIITTGYKKRLDCFLSFRIEMLNL